MSEPFISHVENGRGNLGHASLEALADALELTTEEREGMHAARREAADRDLAARGPTESGIEGALEEVRGLIERSLEVPNSRLDYHEERLANLERRVAALGADAQQWARAAASGQPDSAPGPEQHRPSPPAEGGEPDYDVDEPP